MKNKPIHSILIICEGEKTETNYLYRIKEEVLSKKIWTENVAINIRPKPPLDEENEDSDLVINKYKNRRKKRQLKIPIIPVVETNIEPQYRAVPTRYVREAQKGLEDNTYNEVWAVFDKDHHPRHKEAFELAEEIVNGKKVNIAFSSVAFEHWILLHFERNTTPFYKSVNCIDYIKGERYIIDYEKKMDIYPLVKSNTMIAVENASWLRTQITGIPIYDLNPYTDIDHLIKRLLQINIEFHWLSIGDNIDFDDLSISINYEELNIISFEIRNQNNTSQIFNKKIYCYSKGKLTLELEVKAGIIIGNNTKNFDLELPLDYISLEGKEIWFEYQNHQINVDLP